MDTPSNGLKATLRRNPIMATCVGLVLLVVVLKLTPDTSATSGDPKGADHATAAPVVEPAPKRLVKVGGNAAVTTAFLGCENLDEFEQFKKLQRAHDEVAMSRFMAGHDCPYLEKGTKAAVEHYSFMHQAFCLRPVGSTSCVWFPLAFVEPS